MAATLRGPKRPLVVGADHKSSPMVVRDRLFVDAAGMSGFAAKLRGAGVDQAVVLSAGDRIEVAAMHDDAVGAADAISAALARHAGMNPQELAGHTYRRFDEDAVRHLFALAASLEALVVGEPKLPQALKAAHDLARDSGASGPELDALLEAAYAAGERVRRETEIGSRPVSIGAAAVQVARDLHGDPARVTCLLIGAGEMGELIAEALVDAGIRDLVITHPSTRRAEAMGRGLDCHVAPYENLATLLDRADIVLSALNARHYAVGRDMVAGALRRRRHKPMFLIDTGVPGDIEPATETLEDAFVYDLDDLERVAREGQATLEAAAARAWTIVDEETGKYLAASGGAVEARKDRLRRRLAALRREALDEAGGDAGKATEILVARVLRDFPDIVEELAEDKNRDDMTGHDAIKAMLDEALRVTAPDEPEK